MCAADDGCVLVGHAVDHPDPAVEVLLMYSSGLHAAAEGRQAPDDRPPRCMLLGLGGLPGDCAENSVVLLDPACAAAEKIPDAEAAAAP